MILKIVTPWPHSLQQGSEGSAGFDLQANGTYVFNNGQLKQVQTGIFTEFPPEYVAILKEKSGLAAKGFSVKAGVIDSDYRGEWIVCLRYDKPNDQSPETVTINYGTKVAQVLFTRNLANEVHQEVKSNVHELTPSQRDVGGFGSTGD